MRIVLLLGIFIAVAASPSDGTDVFRCPTYWVPFGSSCYRVYASRKTWEEAHVHCSQQGKKSDLVSIESEAENVFVSTLWETSHGVFVTDTYTYWIGLKRSRSSWCWSNHSPFVYKRWGSGEPNNSGGREDCVHQWKKRSDTLLTWNDLPCNIKLSYVCKMPNNHCNN